MDDHELFVRTATGDDHAFRVLGSPVAHDPHQEVREAHTVIPHRRHVVAAFREPGIHEHRCRVLDIHINEAEYGVLFGGQAPGSSDAFYQRIHEIVRDSGGAIALPVLTESRNPGFAGTQDL